MLPRPALSTKWTALRSARKSLCWDTRLWTSDLKWVAVSSVMRPRQTRVRVPSGETLCSIVNVKSGEGTGFVDIKITPLKQLRSPPTNAIRAGPGHCTAELASPQLSQRRIGVGLGSAIVLKLGCTHEPQRCYRSRDQGVHRPARSIPDWNWENLRPFLREQLRDSDHFATALKPEPISGLATTIVYTKTEAYLWISRVVDCRNEWLVTLARG
jgi:hypothetical protein